MRIIYIFIIAYTFFVHPINAQFSKKLNFNAFTGSVTPFGTKTDPDGIPYAFSNFKTGPQIGAGVQYNLNPHISLGLNVKAFYLDNWNNPLPEARTQLGNNAVNIEEQEFNSYYFNLGIGLDFQYKLFSDTRFNPYFIAEGNVNLYSLEVQPRQIFLSLFTPTGTSAPEFITDKFTILRFNSITVTNELNFGFTGGVGLDIKLSDSFGLFVQGTYNSIFTQNQEKLRRISEYIGSLVGIRFSLFKSKSLLEE